MNKKLSVIIPVFLLLLFSGSGFWSPGIFCQTEIKLLKNDYPVNLNGKIKLNKKNVIKLQGLEKDNIYVDKVFAVAADKNGSIYFCGSGNQVVVLNKEGKLSGTFGNTGEGPGEFKGTNNLKVDEMLNIYVLDGNLKRISLFDSKYVFKKSIKYSGLASDFDVHDPSAIYVSFYGFAQIDNLVSIYDIDAGKKTSFVQNSKEVGKIHMSGNGGKVKVLNDKSILYADPYPYQIQKYNPGNSLEFVLEMKRKEFVGLTKQAQQIGHQLKGSELINRISQISTVLNKYIVVDCTINSAHVLDFFTINGKYISSCELQKGHELGDIAGNILYTFTRGGDDYPEISVWEIVEK